MHNNALVIINYKDIRVNCFNTHTKQYNSNLFTVWQLNIYIVYDNIKKEYQRLRKETLNSNYQIRK